MCQLQEASRHSESGALLHLQQERRGPDVPAMEEGSWKEACEMKRTPLKRSRKPMKRTPLKRKKPLKARNLKKRSEPGSAAYLKWIRSLPCIICGGVLGKSEAAHTKVLGDAGMAQKTTSRSCIPLCCWDHTLRWDSYHEIHPESEWAELHGVRLERLVQSLNDLYDSMRTRRAA